MRSDTKDRRALAATREALSKWLQEWAIHKALAGVAQTEEGGAAAECTSSGDCVARRRGDGGDASAGAALHVGQVRLLGRVGVAGPRPVYCVLLAKRGGVSWLVAPFSRFANPAVPGEWVTGLRAAPLRVLCLWNARVVDCRVFESSWYSGAMKPVRVAEALDVWRRSMDGAPLEGGAPSRTGPPLFHPLDPRHEYLQEERDVIDAHLGYARGEAPRAVPLLYEIPGSELRKAAEERSKYGKEGKKD